MRRRNFVLLVVCLTSIPVAFAYAQLGGSRAGLVDQAGRPTDPPILAPKPPKRLSRLKARAELRTPPTEIRIVLAVTTDGEAAKDCQASIRQSMDKLRDAWSEAGVNSDNVVEDFIAVLPRFEWNIEQRGGVDVGVERKSGYRMQTNLHVAVPDDQRAQAALAAAFEHGVTDIIAFDYFSDDLDELKVQALAQALEAARNKADFLLGELLGGLPPVINVQEQTTVHPPETQYQSFTNAIDQEVTPAPRRDVPLFRAGRPRNTYYRGLSTNSDIQPPDYRCGQRSRSSPQFGFTTSRRPPSAKTSRKSKKRGDV